MSSSARRTRQLARIHCLKREHELDDARYRDLVWAIGRKRSAGELDEHGRLQLIAQLSGQPKPRSRRSYPGRPHNTDQKARRELTKIEALLADAGRPWAYAQALARRIAKRDRLEFCGSADLYKIVAALELDARKRLREELVEECGRRGLPLVAASQVATKYFGKSLRAELEKDAQSMSLVLRWLRGEVTTYTSSEPGNSDEAPVVHRQRPLPAPPPVLHADGERA